jgi:molybdopterin-guanine dinucleotide biosynthesis protein A
VTGVILAGGKSSRYGTNKALVRIRGERIIDLVLHVIKQIFSDILLITNTPRDYAYLELKMVEDIVRGIGPLGGIYTGLKHIGGQNGFFVACDMPFLNASLIRHMTTICGGFDVTIPKISGEFHTLHAIYHRNCLPHIENLIELGDYKITNFFGTVKVRCLAEKDLQHFDPDFLSFLNVNTHEDFEKLTKLIEVF